MRPARAAFAAVLLALAACRPRAAQRRGGAAGCFVPLQTARPAPGARTHSPPRAARPAAPAAPAAPWRLAGGAAAGALAAALAAGPRRSALAGAAVSRAVLRGVVARAVTISGVVGGEAEKNANGEFVEAAAPYGGRRHWQKKSDADVWLLYIKGRWWVTDTADKDAEASSGWICSEESQAQDPFGVTTWEAYVKDEWVVQGSITVSDSSSDGAEDAAEDAALAEAAPTEGGVITTLPDGTVRFKVEAAEPPDSTAEPKTETTKTKSVVTTLPDGTVRFKAGSAPATPKKKEEKKKGKGILRRVWNKLRGKK